jgi:hypothetical protein
MINGKMTLDLGGYLGLTRIEWAASLRAVPYDVIVKWRYEGWPTKCSECGERMIPENFGWMGDVDKEGNGILTHIKCLKPRPERDEIH